MKVPEKVFRAKYPAQTHEGHTNWSGHIKLENGVVAATAKTEAELLERLSEGLYLELEEQVESEGQIEEPRAAAEGEKLVSPARPSEVSAMLCRALESSGMTQSQVAKRMGCSQGTISKLLDCFNHNHSEVMLRRFAKALGKKMKFSLEG